MYVFLIVLAFCALYIPVALKMIKKKKDEAAAYLAANPTASKIYTKTGLWDLYSSEQIMVGAVNDAPPNAFYDGLKEGQGFFALPGKNVIDVQYSRVRPGIMHKSVTTGTGMTKQELDIAPNKRYRLTFNRQETRFILEELPPQAGA